MIEKDFGSDYEKVKIWELTTLNEIVPVKVKYFQTVPNETKNLSKK